MTYFQTGTMTFTLGMSMLAPARRTYPSGDHMMRVVCTLPLLFHSSCGIFTHIPSSKTVSNSRVNAKVKCTLIQALRLYTGHTAHKESRGIALLFLGQGTRRGVKGPRHAPAALYPWERPGTHFTGGWVGPRAVIPGSFLLFLSLFPLFYAMA